MSYPIYLIGSGENNPEHSSTTKTMRPLQRQKLAVKVLAKTQSVSKIAENNGVSRKFLYRQANKASQALDDAFNPKPDDSEVLFYLPVTKEWLRQFVVVLALVCHSSLRGIIQAASVLLDTVLSLGTVHNYLHSVVKSARRINADEDLSAIKVGAHDEIFQSRKPILVGADVRSTYCYLLAQEQSRGGNAWGVHLLDLQDKGLKPDYTIADGGRGLRAGQAEAWPGVPCHGDVFHALRDMGRLKTYLENRAYGTITARDKMERKMERAKRRTRHNNKLSKKLGVTRIAERNAVELAEDVAILLSWMRDDILAVVGPDPDSRRELFDFVIKELREREPLALHRIRPVRRKLENQRDDLLAFAAVLEEQLAKLAGEYKVPLCLVRAVYELQGFSETDACRWWREQELRDKLGPNFYPVKAAVIEIIGETIRASSIIENLNSRLRNYFFLRRHLGPEYLDLLRFFLNHRRFMRSRRSEREGRSPAELLTGQSHPHWLELLGFGLFKRSA